mmetsp:Transcript_15343/g.25012  ORF Transcript_15343/g.25012 Transcript_15343/m.25012 type:complete len:306 (-) Transcript_15343:1039-1956(-)
MPTLVEKAMAKAKAKASKDASRRNKKIDAAPADSPKKEGESMVERAMRKAKENKVTKAVSPKKPVKATPPKRVSSPARGRPTTKKVVTSPTVDLSRSPRPKKVVSPKTPVSPVNLDRSASPARKVSQPAKQPSRSRQRQSSKSGRAPARSKTPTVRRQSTARKTTTTGTSFEMTTRDYCFSFLYKLLTSMLLVLVIFFILTAMEETAEERELSNLKLPYFEGADSMDVQTLVKFDKRQSGTPKIAVGELEAFKESFERLSDNQKKSLLLKTVSEVAETAESLYSNKILRLVISVILGALVGAKLS